MPKTYTIPDDDWINALDVAFISIQSGDTLEVTSVAQMMVARHVLMRKRIRDVNIELVETKISHASPYGTSPRLHFIRMSEKCASELLKKFYEECPKSRPSGGTMNFSGLTKMRVVSVSATRSGSPNIQLEEVLLYPSSTKSPLPATFAPSMLFDWQAKVLESWGVDTLKVYEENEMSDLLKGKEAYFKLEKVTYQERKHWTVVYAQPLTDKK